MSSKDTLQCEKTLLLDNSTIFSSLAILKMLSLKWESSNKTPTAYIYIYIYIYIYSNIQT